MSKKYYLAGPMTGIPGFNFPLFDRAVLRLRDSGLDIVSPHENDSEAVQAAARASVNGDAADLVKTGETWAEMLARDVVLVGDVCGGVIFLPDWIKSRGARLEAFTGLLCGKKFGVYIDSDGAEPVEWVEAEAVRGAIRANMP